MAETRSKNLSEKTLSERTCQKELVRKKKSSKKTCPKITPKNCPEIVQKIRTKNLLLIFNKVKKIPGQFRISQVQEAVGLKIKTYFYKLGFGLCWFFDAVNEYPLSKCALGISGHLLVHAAPANEVDKWGFAKATICLTRTHLFG